MSLCEFVGGFPLHLVYRVYGLSAGEKSSALTGAFLFDDDDDDDDDGVAIHGGKQAGKKRDRMNLVCLG